MNLKWLNIFVLYFCAIQLNAKNVPQFFIKISPGQETVKYGTLHIGTFTTKPDYFTKGDKPVEVDPRQALSRINDSITEISKDSKSKVLFFIHGFWGSLPYSLHRTSKSFKNDYFNSDSTYVVAVVHIIWNASGVQYKQSISSINNSNKTLAAVLNNIGETIDFKRSLMCHSMGNRFLHKTISNNVVGIRFSELIMMAPDLDYRKFEKDLDLFTSLADKVYVFYHKKDLTLNMSKSINDVERLGRMSKYSDKTNIRFIDCTDIKDISNVLDKINNHIYFITSKTVISKVREILNEPF